VIKLVHTHKTQAAAMTVAAAVGKGEAAMGAGSHPWAPHEARGQARAALPAAEAVLWRPAGPGLLLLVAAAVAVVVAGLAEAAVAVAAPGVEAKVHAVQAAAAAATEAEAAAATSCRWRLEVPEEG